MESIPKGGKSVKTLYDSSIGKIKIEGKRSNKRSKTRPLYIEQTRNI